MIAQLQATRAVFERLDPGNDVLLGFLPISHMYGLQLLVHFPLVVGVPVVILPRFEERAVLSAIERYKITFALVVPPVLITLLRSPTISRYDLTSLRGMLSAAAPLSESLCDQVKSILPDCVITQAYGELIAVFSRLKLGLTETSPLAHCMTLSEAVDHQGTVGKLLPTYEARLVDPETGLDVPKGLKGELWLRGPSVMKGYLDNVSSTTQTFTQDELGGAPWFRTGDVAVRSDDGFYTVVDRLKELIKYKGFQGMSRQSGRSSS